MMVVTGTSSSSLDSVQQHQQLNVINSSHSSCVASGVHLSSNMGSGSVRSSHQSVSDYTLCLGFPNTQQSRFL